MRIFVAGATGVIGRVLLRRLRAHQVYGMTRSRPEMVSGLGAEPVVVDVFERDAVIDALAAARPEVVVNLLTDLAQRDFEANNRIRRIGSRNLVDAAVQAEARRLVVESVDLDLSPAGAAAVSEMEAYAQASGLETFILRFPNLWGPGTWHEHPGEEGAFLHVEDAASSVYDAIFTTPFQAPHPGG